MTQLSVHFSLEELTHTETGLPNHPGEAEMDNLRRTAHAMDAVRDLLGHPVIVHSGFRSVAVNQVVGGAPNSQHIKGEACDFTCPDFGTPQEIAHKILDSGLVVDQMIFEHSWLHLSFADPMRRQALTAHFAAGQPTRYTPGIA